MTDGAVLFAAFIERNAITLVAAGKALGVSGPTIYDWSTGKKRPRWHHREAIAVWTRDDVPADSWLTDDERAAMRDVRPFVPPAESGPSLDDDDAAEPLPDTG
jgi:hypothetical protein